MIGQSIARDAAGFDYLELCITPPPPHAYPSYSKSFAAEEVLLTGGEGDVRYTLNSRPVMSLSNSNRLLRSKEVFELEQSSPSKQRCDRETAAGAFSATVGPEALILFLP